jgi:RimJ/RimL family protein N-acetyltransferase
MGRQHAEVFLQLLKGEGFAQPSPRPMFPNPPGLLRLEPHSEGLRERIWWGSASNATAVWAAKQGMNLQSSTLKNDETGEPFHIQQAAQIKAYRAAWKEAGHERTPRVSVSRSIFAIMDDRDRAYFGRGGDDDDQIGFISPETQAIFGRGYAAEAATAVLELAFGRLGLHRVFAELDPRNVASIRLCSRLGMRHEAEFLENMWFKGEWADTGVYAVLAREWAARAV